MCSTGAALPSTEDARRSPVPVKTNASAFPRRHPGRLSTCCATARTSDVRCAVPESPAAVQATGLQVARAWVHGRDVTVVGDVVKDGVSSSAMPPIWTVVVPEFAPTDVNWTHASVTVAPWGTSTLSKRIPTVCVVPPLFGMFSVAVAHSAYPVGRCSTSSNALDTGMSSGRAPPAATTVTNRSSDPVSAESLATARTTYVPAALNVAEVWADCGAPKVTVPGPLTACQLTVVEEVGSPSSRTTACRESGSPTCVGRSGPTETTGARLGIGGSWTAISYSLPSFSLGFASLSTPRSTM